MRAHKPKDTEMNKEILELLDKACTAIANSSNKTDAQKEELIDLISEVQNKIEEE
jgi:hypothetical protein